MFFLYKNGKIIVQMKPNYYLCGQNIAKMDNQHPQRLPLSSLRELKEQGLPLKEIAPFSTEDFAVTSQTNAGPVIRNMVKPGTPYRIDDYRFVFFQDGDAEVTANLQKCHFQAGTVVFVGNGSIVQFDRINRTPTISAVVLSGNYLRMVMGGRLPQVLNGSLHNFHFIATGEELQVACDMTSTLRKLCGQTGYSRAAANALLSAIVHYVCSLYERHAEEQSLPKSRAQQVFTDFIALVNEHAARHHTLGYYASRLCITQRYLGTLVQQASGTPAKEWIDRAIVTDAKVALRHSDVSISQLSERLCFPNVSFFCKYFRRLTGMTPTEYRVRSEELGVRG